MIGYLNLSEEEAVIKLKTLLVKKLSNNLKHLYLFGSKARGDYRNDSDIDILVVADSVDTQTKDLIRDAVLDIQLEFDIPIAIHIRSANYYNEQSNNRLNMFMQNIIQDGIAI